MNYRKTVCGVPWAGVAFGFTTPTLAAPEPGVIHDPWSEPGQSQFSLPGPVSPPRAPGERDPASAAHKSEDATAEDRHAEEGRIEATEVTPQDYQDQKSGAVAPNRARRLEEDAGPETEDYYLFAPRAILFLPNLALKALFYPIRQTAIFVDEYRVVPHVRDLLYNDARTAGIVPVVGYESGYGLTGGAKVFHNDVLLNDEEVSLSAEYGGRFLQAYKFSFEGERLARSRLWLEVHASYERQGGVQFWGIGNQSLDAQTPVAPAATDEVALETRFREDRTMASSLIGQTIEEHGRQAKVGVVGIYNHREFGAPSRRFSEPATSAVYAVDELTGFDTGTDVIEVGPAFIYDSRDNEVFTRSGAYFDTFASHARALKSAAGYWHYGVALAGFINLYRGTRVLSVRGILEAVHGRSEDIPFTNLAELGGPDRLRGYGSGRFRDQISMVATAEYRYPIHDYVAGEVFADVGRVGGRYGEVFEPSNESPLRAGGGLGFVVHDQEKVLVKAEAAYGEELIFFLTSSPLDLFGERHERL